MPPLITVFATIAIAFAGGVWALIRWGFGGVTDLVNARFDAVDQRFEDQNGLIDARFDAVDQRFVEQSGLMEARFERGDARFDAVDQRFESVESRFDSVDIKIDAVDKRVDAVDRRIDEMRVDLRALVNRVDAFQAAVVPSAIGPA